MKIGIASDHRGFETKQKMTKYLKEKGYDVIDYGTNDTTRVDYTKYVFILGENVSNHNVDYGIELSDWNYDEINANLRERIIPDIDEDVVLVDRQLASSMNRH